MNAPVEHLIPQSLNQLHGNLSHLLSDLVELKALYLATAPTAHPFAAQRMPSPLSKLGVRPYSLNLPII